MNEINPIERIRELCGERGWTLYHLSKASGITYSTLSTLINKQNMPSLSTLYKLCRGFGISITDFFEPDKSLGGLTDEQAQCLSLFTQLSNEDRQLVLAYIKGLSRKL